MRHRAEAYEHDVVAFIDDQIQFSELGKPFTLFTHQKEVLRLAFAFDDDGRLPWDTILYSCVKKSGKTAVNAAVILWWAFTQEAPNEILILANDLEQATDRVFKSVVGMLRHNPGLGRSAQIGMKTITLSTGTTISVIASEYAGASGSNHGLTSWDELWAYTLERSIRLYEELTPVPTRDNSIRFITTYAGWEGESKLLSDLYRQGVGPDEHPEALGERLHEDLPVYGNREARVFAYWDHTPRMPWQTEAYYNAQRRTLRPGTYLRLHENRWTTAETSFIDPELWDPCVDRGVHPLLPTRRYPVYVGVDGATKHDSAAVVAVYWLDENTLALANHHIWRPSPEHPLDLEATIEAYLSELHRQYHVRDIRCDPWQMHASITRLKARGLRIQEYPQTQSNLTAIGQALFDLLNGRNFKTYPAADLRQHALNTVAVDTPRGWRIAKEKASKKIDGIVALAMASVAAIEGKNVPQIVVKHLLGL
jgi:phage terminase large subunit-like protein